ncbi:nuclear transport factor 2 family protein [Acidisoma cellulosilytica]|uniref:Nuclear transport factor 2 family protein n=1 Tax=Acidisoma cellulosilyticum TaxID=2802395 RepID=A0A963Z298_9PROT|nr:nuclear transport factor 2 family protein [Acidisoma cellulosilyticum]MCB8881286.1 nuclear transport factor 2 family protein [Acidisoma cellulosilyticum]
MAELSLEQRVARLESLEEIRTLKAVYCDLCDRGYEPVGLSALFTEDAVWDGGPFGKHEGRQAIHDFFAGVSNSLVFAAHLVMNPVISFIDDDTAEGKWRLWEPATVNEDGKLVSKILLSAYEDVYVRQDGKWLVKSLKLHVNFFAPLADGWAGIAVS